MEIGDTDNGYKALTELVFGLAARQTSITVGVHEDAGAHGDGGLSVVEVALFNEFGTANIPARSFIRAWFDENEAQLREDLVVLMQSVVAGKRTKEQVLELIGQRAVSQIQERISSSIPPPNAPSTVKKKGSSTTLIDTGVLRSSIAYKIQDGGGGT